MVYLTFTFYQEIAILMTEIDVLVTRRSQRLPTENGQPEKFIGLKRISCSSWGEGRLFLFS